MSTKDTNRVVSHDGKLVLVFDRDAPSDVSIHDARTDSFIGSFEPPGEFKWACFSPSADAIFVGGKNILSFDVSTQRKNKLSFKGHRAPSNCMVTDAARNRLYSVGGDYIYSDDRLVRAFDVATGEQLWKFGGKNSGFLCCALFDDVIVVAAENGVLYMLDPDDGTLVGEAIVDSGCTLQKPGSSIWLGVSLTRFEVKSGALHIHYWKGEGKNAEDMIATVNVSKKTKSIAVVELKSLGKALPQ
jgi:outer membrane protein assembly factor BamB